MLKLLSRVLVSLIFFLNNLIIRFRGFLLLWLRLLVKDLGELGCAPLAITLDDQLKNHYAILVFTLYYASSK